MPASARSSTSTGPSSRASASPSTRRSPRRTRTARTACATCRTFCITARHDAESMTWPYRLATRAPRRRGDGLADWPLWKCVDATSAAPTFFAPCVHKVRLDGHDGDDLLDGGVLANNPTGGAPGGGLAERPIAVVFSVGCGKPATGNENPSNGMLYWGSS